MSAAANFFKREKKELSPKQQKIRTALNWIVNIICVLIIILALAISVMTITRTSGNKGVANIFGTAFMPVQSDSMSGTFEEDDLILTKIYKGDGLNLNKGQVISFWTNRNGQRVINTHRIVEIVNSNGSVLFRTKGDNETDQDSFLVPVEDVVATWGTADAEGNTTNGKNWGQIGKAINWLQEDRSNYFLTVVLPLILLFVIYAFVLIRTFVIAKLAKAKTEGAAAQLSEEEKKRLAEEYLASLKSSEDKGEASDEEESIPQPEAGSPETSVGDGSSEDCGK